MFYQRVSERFESKQVATRTKIRFADSIVFVNRFSIIRPFPTLKYFKCCFVEHTGLRLLTVLVNKVADL